MRPNSLVDVYLFKEDNLIKGQSKIKFEDLEERDAVVNIDFQIKDDEINSTSEVLYKENRSFNNETLIKKAKEQFDLVSSKFIQVAKEIPKIEASRKENLQVWNDYKNGLEATFFLEDTKNKVSVVLLSGDESEHLFENNSIILKNHFIYRFNLSFEIGKWTNEFLYTHYIDVTKALSDSYKKELLKEIIALPNFKQEAQSFKKRMKNF